MTFVIVHMCDDGSDREMRFAETLDGAKAWVHNFVAQGETAYVYETKKKWSYCYSPLTAPATPGDDAVAEPRP